MIKTDFNKIKKHILSKHNVVTPWLRTNMFKRLKSEWKQLSEEQKKETVVLARMYRQHAEFLNLQ